MAWSIRGALALLCVLSNGAQSQSPTWTRATDDIPWSPRVGEAIVLHDERLWMLGGSLDDSQACRNDVWVSSDGVAWEQVLEHAPWVPRTAHGAVSFKGELWLLGGFDCERMVLGDFWRSNDGIAWEQVPNPPFEPRQDHAAVVFQEKLWVVGGGLGENTPYNDVWYTEDGVAWVQASENAPWSARANFATAVHDNKLWILGGRTGYGEWVRDVWYMEDGETWHAAGEAPWTARYATASLSHGGKLWLFGGRVDREFQDDAESNEIWSTTDGSDWVLEREHASWMPRTGHTAVNFRNKRYLIGGGSKIGHGKEVWASEDCVRWTNALGERWTPRIWHATVEHDGYLWVIGGATPTGQPSDIWRSRNGTSWENVPYEASWKHLMGAVAVSFQGRIWVLSTQEPRGGEARVWSSEDGKVWQEAPSPPWIGRIGQTATVYDDKIWVVGGMTNTRMNTAIYNDVWYTSDGQEWHEAKSGDGEYEKGLAQVGSRSNHGAAVYDGKLWIAGGVDVQWEKVADVWWTTNGYEWTQATEEGPFLQLDGPELVAFNNHLCLVGGSSARSGGDGGSGRKVWATKDGENWAPYGGDVPWYPRQDPGVLVMNDRLWLLGGESVGYGRRNNDVWYTEGGELPDIPKRTRTVVPEEQSASVLLPRKPSGWIGTLGVDWTTVKRGGEVPGQTQVQPLVFDDQLWIHEGNRYWRTSKDGNNWTSVPAARDFYGPGPFWSGSPGMVVHQGGLWDIRSNQLGEGSVWKSENGNDWELVKESMEWGADDGWVCGFRDKLWYIGGLRPVRWTNVPQPVSQTWSSTNGKDWEIVTERTPWDGFENYNHFLFNDKMWIVGGYDQNGRRGAAWMSENGRDWEEISQRPDVFSPPGEAPQLFSTGERLWATESTGGTAKNLWSTTDGVHWEKYVENLELPQHTEYFSVEYNGLWLIPRGDGHYQKMPSPIFYSPDQETWRQFTFGGPTLEMYETILTIHEEQFWLFDAKPSEDYLPLSRVYSSPDAVNWALVTDSPAWGERSEMGVVSHGGKLWMFGGHDGGRSDGNPGKLYNDVWVAEDGKDWKRILEAAPWEARMSPYVVSLNEKMILMCGMREPVEPYDVWLNDVWATTDGITWEPLASEVPFRLSGDGSPPFVFDGKIWVLGAMEKDRPSFYRAGTKRVYSSKIWNSEDGVTWNSVIPDKTWIPRYSVGAVAHDGRLWAIGGITEGEQMSDVLPHRPVNRVEWSKDGISWTVVSTLPLDSSHNYDKYHSMGGRMWRISTFPDAIAFSGTGE